MKKISTEYLELQKKLHKNPNYGLASAQYANLIKKIFLDNNFVSISDYGAGKRNLKRELKHLGLRNFQYFPYDPAFQDDPDYSDPMPADLVCCLDVLEHIEPDYLNNVLDDLRKITVNTAIFTIATRPASKFLDDGRNAHLIIKPINWWLSLLLPRFEIEYLQKIPTGFLILLRSNSL
jgi:hypothetical protein